VSNLNSQFRTWCARKAFNTVFLSKITEISSSHCTTSVIRKEHTYHNRDSSVGTANQYELEGLGIESRWEARPSAPIQTAPGAHQASYTMGTGSFTGVKRPGRGADHPPPSSTEVRERVQLYLYSPSGPLWPLKG